MHNLSSKSTAVGEENKKTSSSKIRPGHANWLNLKNSLPPEARHHQEMSRWNRALLSFAPWVYEMNVKCKFSPLSELSVLCLDAHPNQREALKCGTTVLPDLVQSRDFHDFGDKAFLLGVTRNIRCRFRSSPSRLLRVWLKLNRFIFFAVARQSENKRAVVGALGEKFEKKVEQMS